MATMDGGRKTIGTTYRSRPSGVVQCGLRQRHSYGREVATPGGDVARKVAGWRSDARSLLAGAAGERGMLQGGRPRLCIRERGHSLWKITRSEIARLLSLSYLNFRLVPSHFLLWHAVQASDSTLESRSTVHNTGRE
uniref:Uncharacterized protein n=1 Tax=Triticum urartu TaxID=4572 RepID=A0A8R7QDC6_TRIUA